MTDTRCKICGNRRYNNNWKTINRTTGYDLYCDKIECQKHYLIDFANHFLDKSNQEETKMIKIGDTVIPKKRPILKGVVRKIGRDFNGRPLYILDNGTMHTEEEIKS